MKKIENNKENIFNESVFQNGIDDFGRYPLIRLYLSKFKKFPHRWNSSDEFDFNKERFDKFIEKYNKYIIHKTYDLTDKQNLSKLNLCVMDMGGQENLFMYINKFEYNDKEKIKISLLFDKKTKRADSLIKEISSILIFKEEKAGEKPHNLYLLVQDGLGFSLEPKEILCPEIDFKLNYNEDFEKINDLIVDELSKENSKGLVLLHGQIGTGKTTYIRYLINVIYGKKIIYIPPAMVSVITDPSLIKFLGKYPNSILVVEDAENILMTRRAGSSQAISNILNLTDGLLSDFLNIQIVATFNMQLLNIDKALLRKGRLIAKYEFNELAEDRVIALAQKLGVKINNKQTLANIYNTEELSFSNERTKVGFQI